jgi:ATP-binding cassette subfamily B protein
MLLSFCGLGFVLWCGGQDVIHGVMTAGELSAFVYYAIIVATSSSSFSDLMSDLQRASAATHRLLMILTLPKKATGTRILSSPTGIVAVHNISFSYPSNPEKVILEDFTLSLAPGENVALAGLTGAGKSTVFSLLLGFYTPQKGSIYIDGIDLNELNIRDIRKHMALVSHDVALFSTSLYENLLIANPKATHQELTQAIELSCLDDVIRNMPKGIHTPIGTKGSRLSGGQKQRLSIARAILRNPKILLLDEATSALDSEMENQLQQNLYQFMKERTSLVIAHHLSTLIRTNRIIVLDQGKIQEVGTHAELMDKNGLYRKLALLQYYDKIDTMKYRHD